MSVTKRLLERPHTFNFAQATRILMSLSESKGMELSLQSDPMPHGAPTDIMSIQQNGKELRVKLGLEALSGCKGVIPDYLYAELLNSLHQDDEALQRFLDVFNQRYYELVAYVESTASVLLREEREVAIGRALNRLTQQSALTHLFALPRQKQEGSDPSLIRYGLAMANKSRSLSGLKRLLCDYFSLDITPRAIASRLYRISPAFQTRIGTRLGQNHKLGHGVLLGNKGAQAYKTLEVCITPRSKKEYLGLLNNRHFSNALQTLALSYLRESVTTKIYLYVKREYIDAPVLSSGALSSGHHAFRLGETNCLAPERRATEYRKILLQSEKG
ncbi:type VI secretion system baseplate subunit TssG [Marinomonas mediterranea]|uniref:type VI secretion system baseplate subunit TssG n=1 Tax=Marinomonas mediterranea TaxID=119864 RepID=UPI00234B623C|nr:type VI secretion system baseplate subunit TssG [Marinomonas mediterranea]WCN08126.1 type VI secretion system baseplate subunit TssG [Marinomonas mediterranea]WCN12196.1 type VI secretion system baseplate subunit TssG [Marinomonas mediterranea]